MARKSKTMQVGDEVTVPATVEVAQVPGDVFVTVRSGGPFRFTAPGRYVLGTTVYEVEAPEVD